MDLVISALRQPKLWVTVASLAFLAVAVAQQGDQLVQQNLDAAGWLWLALGLGFSWLSILLNGVAWRVLVAWLGHRQQQLALVPLFVRTNVLKYLPGGIWHLVERVRVLRHSIGAAPALAAVLLDPLLIVAAALLLLLPGGWQSGLVCLAPLPAVVLLPRWREPLLRRLERTKASSLERAGAGVLSDAPQGSGRQGYPWTPLIWDLGFVLCRFSGFFCCVQAFRVEGAMVGSWLAAFSLAYAVGLVVPGAPGGLGVFEATLLMRFGASVPEAGLLAVVLSYRLVSTLADLIAAGALELDQWLHSRVGPQR